MTDRQKGFSIIDKGLEVEGALNFKGKLLIVGALKGTLLGDTVVTAEGSNVSVRAKVREMIIGGDFEGDIMASERLKILKTGSFSGKVICKRLAVEAGGQVHGHVEPLDSKDAVSPADTELEAAASILQAASKGVSPGVSPADTELEAAG